MNWAKGYNPVLLPGKRWRSRLQTHVTLTIYNLLGQEVVRLVDQVQAAGRYEAVWHGVNSRGAGVASGVYLYRIVSGSGYTDTKRMTLLK